MRFLAAALNLFHDEHEEVLTWYGKPFDRDDIDERYVRMGAHHHRQPPSGRPDASSRERAVTGVIARFVRRITPRAKLAFWILRLQMR